MITQDRYNINANLTTLTANRFGFYAAISTTILTFVTFGFALSAIPISGANCPADCVNYPYLDTVAQYPQDFRWMPVAMGLVLAYLALMIAIHFYAPEHKKIFSQAGVALALIATAILLVDYFLQFSVIPMSLQNNETAGVALLIQYNPHGVFLALEELGYLLMALSFLCVAPVFAHKGRLETAVQWVFIAAFVLVIVSLASITSSYGLDRQDRLEVAILSIDWLGLLVNGVLLSVVFGRRLKTDLEGVDSRPTPLPGPGTA